jgi:S-adenosylmethionine:tRNA ribosyltransferase-isomerase
MIDMITASTPTHWFDYTLDPERIAAHPTTVRDQSRLLVYDRKRDKIEHCVFTDMPDWLTPADLLVMNDTRVIPARLFARKSSGGRVEVLLLSPISGSELHWEVWVRGTASSRLTFEGGVRGHFSEEGGRKRIRFELPEGPGGPEGMDFQRFITRWGEIPLPPYILKKRGRENGRGATDAERYQTVYARHEGSVAAPTAGLHFTEALLQRIQGRGVQTASITLQIGPGTFQPIRTETLEGHVMHREGFNIPTETAAQVDALRAASGRLVAVGTTVTRALESAIGEEGSLRAGHGESDLFIRPGYCFKAVDALITNFHLPRSTLLVLVSAFAGCEAIQRVYREAMQKAYRFYSFGDAMLIV